MNPTKQATILVVDDKESNRKLLEALLAADGHAVRIAASGTEALAAVAQQLPDLILLDIMMPVLDGFEVTRMLKADSRSRSIPIILVTALEDRESRLKGLELGAEDFLNYPVDRAELLVRVRNLLKLKEYQDFLADHNRILEQQVRLGDRDYLISISRDITERKQTEAQLAEQLNELRRWYELTEVQLGAICNHPVIYKSSIGRRTRGYNLMRYIALCACLTQKVFPIKERFHGKKKI